MAEVKELTWADLEFHAECFMVFLLSFIGGYLLCFSIIVAAVNICGQSLLKSSTNSLFIPLIQ